MNEYVTKMKSAITGYEKARKDIYQAVDTIAQLYGKDAAAVEMERNRDRLILLREKAFEAINGIGEAGRKHAEEWGRINGSRLTDDAKLLDAGLVNADEFEILKGKYKDNSTMLTALKKYGEKQNSEITARGDDYAPRYNVRDISTGPDRLKNWDDLIKQGTEVLDMIDGTGRYAGENASLGRNLSAEIIRTFGEGKDY